MTENEKVGNPTEPSRTTIKRLFAVSSNKCAFPKSESPLIDGKTVIGRVCHIKAQNAGLAASFLRMPPFVGVKRFESPLDGLILSVIYSSHIHLGQTLRAEDPCRKCRSGPLRKSFLF